MKSELFFKLYLEEHKLKYKLKDDIYTVKLDSTHQKWFNSKELKLTFNPKIKSDNLHLLNEGHSFINTMAMQHLDEVPIASLKIKDNKDGLKELNERLTEVNDLNAIYQIDEKQETCVFTYFEIMVNTAKNKFRFKIPLIEIQNEIIDATGIEESEFINSEILPSPEKKYMKLFNELTNIMKPKLDKFWKQHEEEIHELSEIQFEYNDQLFAELKKKETIYLIKIQEKEMAEIGANTFSQKSRLKEEIRKLKKKHKDLVEANKSKRLKITLDSEVQMSALKKRDLNTQVDILAYAEINLNYYQINYENKDNYLFIPCLHKFVKLK